MRGLSPEHRRLVLVFAVLLLPLAALLGLQYRWLKRLERANAMARHAALDNYLHAVGNEVQYFYLTQAERVLNLPASLFIEQRIGSAAAFWEKKPVEGARTLFLVDFTQDTYGHYWVYEASSHSIVRALASDESLAIILACSPWQMLRFQHDPTSTGMPVADERDPQNRIILRPITDDAARVIGVTGMILDETYFRTRLLPNILTEALPGFFHDGGRNQTVVTVRDRRRELVLRTANDDQPDTVEHDFPFVFTDWTLGLHERGATPARWARANFALNMGLAACFSAMEVVPLTLLTLDAWDFMRLRESRCADCGRAERGHQRSHRTGADPRAAAAGASGHRSHRARRRGRAGGAEQQEHARVGVHGRRRWTLVRRGLPARRSGAQQSV